MYFVDILENILKIIGFLTFLKYALRGLRIVIVEIVKEVENFIYSIKKVIYKEKQKKQIRVEKVRKKEKEKVNLKEKKKAINIRNTKRVEATGDKEGIKCIINLHR